LSRSLARRPDTESLDVARDVTANSFWTSRVNKCIIRLDLLQSLYAAEGARRAFGLEVFFADADSFVIEYLSDEEHQDQLRITGPYEGPSCRRIEVK
jgi:hypothetical protein